MFKLFKLASYGLLVYTLYELFQGLSSPRNKGSSAARQAPTEGAGRMTGGGRGVRIPIDESTGASGTRAVGRGVMH